jgi:hypothetical protein
MVLRPEFGHQPRCDSLTPPPLMADGHPFQLIALNPHLISGGRGVKTKIEINHVIVTRYNV